MNCIDGDKLIELLTIERDKAEVWRRDCVAFGSKQVIAATQAVLDWNKAILLVKGMESELSCEDCQRLGGVM